ncbi:M28 family metallopeptidase [Mucilaginibacter myungsuensis]|uniref:M28 family peptidase n=1 Tax=Mucilaginibacter myungsuensis TaxID=649104 RepID=A0A929KT54_9SPHI|nr:M28 family metallopeptidase [Mucilaginibacter myungsuensis]MBE9661074.1 M28 family peptidase [Mucilaginibacter myungsuensis]MDN3597218.1 M28 family metallopeptidase [Mucilaginibacter myungsuensis]
MIKLNHNYLLIAALALATGCSDPKSAGPTVSGDDIKTYLTVLAHDSLQGRKPFTEGETKTVKYLSEEYQKLGLEPGNNGSFFQNVPMVEVTSTPSPTMQISGKANMTFKFSDDYVALTRREVPSVELKNSPLVFAGYGVVAPEYNWNDYKDLDVKGKTVVVLVNDPGFKSGDPKFFHGDTMTYYGRWTYKFEEAARQGAAGVLIVHQTEPASYPWQVVQTSNTGAKLELTQPDKHMNRCQIEGWISEATATKLLASAGISGDIRAVARKKDFKAVSLGLDVTLGVQTKLKYSESKNVVAMIKGSKRPDEYIIYSGHWDHLGIGKPDAKGDSIYNGAVDNGTGSAALLAIAKAFMNAKEKPERSIIFLAVTAEEQGLLGSEYYGTHPIFPVNKTVANLNMDALHTYGPTKDISVTGKGQSELEDELEVLAKGDGLYLVGDPKPGAGSYYRSDHFNFAKIGIPALDINNGTESVTKGKEWGAAEQKAYTENKYHQASDNFSADMDMSGMVQTADLLYRLGTKLANDTKFPGWKAGSEFKAIRDKLMAGK